MLANCSKSDSHKQWFLDSTDTLNRALALVEGIHDEASGMAASKNSTKLADEITALKLRLRVLGKPSPDRSAEDEVTGANAEAAFTRFDRALDELPQEKKDKIQFMVTSFEALMKEMRDL